VLFDIVNQACPAKESAMDVKTPPTQLPAPAAPAPADMTVPDLAKAINDRLSAIAINTRNTLQRSIEIGDLLLEAKERVGHGNFEAWPLTVPDLATLNYFWVVLLACFML
jgi:hypothetical protein